MTEHKCVPADILFTKAEAAAMTKRCLRSIDYAIANGELRAIRHGRRVYLTRASVEEYALKDRERMASLAAEVER